MSAPRDVVIIGAGHNGLATAFYLARAGMKPLVLEARPNVGGAAITDQWHPGFRGPTLAHACGPVDRRVLADMRLDRHGLHMLEPEVRVFAPVPDGRGLVLPGDAARAALAIGSVSRADAERYPEFCATVSRIAGAFEDLPAMTPPDLDGPSTGDLLRLLRTGSRVRRLGKKDLYRLLRWAPMAVADLAAEWFESEPLRAVIAARGVFGSFLGPWSAGTGAMYLMRLMADGDPLGRVTVPRGGMGALTQAMATAAREAGAEIRTGAGVSRIEIGRNAVTGIVLDGGETISCRSVVSNADPRRTFLGLIDPLHLDPGFLRRVRNYRAIGATAKVNLALDRLPSFTGLPPGDAAARDGAAALMGRIHIGPTIDDLERAFDDAKYGGLPRRPWLEVTIPSLADPSLAPPGKHVMSIYAQYFPMRLKEGTWAARRDELGDLVVGSLAAYAPDLPKQILSRRVITPSDLEETYGLTGGHIFHGEMSLDQLYTMRPFLGCARYRAPIHGLYLCGAGTHPGGGVTGAPGRNASREILKDLRSRAS